MSEARTTPSPPPFADWDALEAAQAKGDLLKEAARYRRWEAVLTGNDTAPELCQEAAQYQRWKAYQRKYPINMDRLMDYAINNAGFFVMFLLPVIHELPLDTTLKFCVCLCYLMLAFFAGTCLPLHVAMNMQKNNFCIDEADVAGDEVRDAGPAEKHVEESV